MKGDSLRDAGDKFIQFCIALSSTINILMKGDSLRDAGDNSYDPALEPMLLNTRPLPKGESAAFESTSWTGPALQVSKNGSRIFRRRTVRRKKKKKKKPNLT